MGKQDISREKVIAALGALAFGRVNRSVELAFSEEVTPDKIRRMDLSAVSEFKKGGNGTVEIKFIDRVKALSALYEMLGSGADEDETEAFFRALEEAGEEGEKGRW